MSVTGILIVVSLMLALQIDRLADNSPSKNMSSDADLLTKKNDKLEELEKTVASLKQKLEILQSAARKTESIVELSAQIARLERRVTELSLRNSTISKNAPPAADLPQVMTKAAEMLQLRKEIGECEKEISRLSESAIKAGDRMRELEYKVKDLEATVIAARIKSQNLLLIRELSDTTKEPIIVDVGEKILRVMRFDQAQVIEVASLQDFRRTMNKFRKQDQYFVLYFRPDGASRFEELKEAVKNSGFEVGYDAIPEGVKLALGKEDDS